MGSGETRAWSSRDRLQQELPGLLGLLLNPGSRNRKVQTLDPAGAVRAQPETQSPRVALAGVSQEPEGPLQPARHKHRWEEQVPGSCQHHREMLPEDAPRCRASSLRAMTLAGKLSSLGGAAPLSLPFVGPWLEPRGEGAGLLPL